jgi:hypothetical protein
MGCEGELLHASAPAGAVKRCGVCAFIARAGFLGFLFFLAKGLLWLAVPYVLFMMGMSE